MTRDDVLTLATLKGTAVTLALLEREYQKLGSTIDVLRDLLQRGGYRNGANNGAEPSQQSRTKEDAARIVAGAHALFARRKARHSRQGGFTVEIKAQRAKTAKLLKLFHEQARPLPSKVKGQAAGVLVRHGYLKPVGGGQYLRTSKPFSVDRP
jgi:hypothetical protein